MARFETAFPESAGSPGLALWRVTNVWQRQIRAALAPFDLTHVQFVLLASLAYLDRAPDLDGVAAPVTQRDLAAHAGTDVMMTSQVVRALEAKGLVTRAKHPGDGRAVALEPTERGVALANQANGAVEAADAAFFGVLPSDDLAGIVRALGALSH
ncbi:MarR family winged helix-turn-helix transcriptional regulator [Frondihabitans australicus]|uniref:DNA-binding MarR family transcriptional regulator n=1 Tax=Frondihabitans australicus TaxID=386892 RepID=A0A495ICR0_9MICO|nr:MarR family winged helix-turn-helix transcriptional regulator [Frondihabitans australicus]RKR73420.1 DNA-binding MarR family transcriptional regulator [Frondihabitans australicus]